MEVLVGGIVLAILFTAVILGHHVKDANHDLRKMLQDKRKSNTVITPEDIDKSLGDK